MTVYTFIGKIYIPQTRLNRISFDIMEFHYDYSVLSIIYILLARGSTVPLNIIYYICIYTHIYSIYMCNTHARALARKIVHA